MEYEYLVNTQLHKISIEKKDNRLMVSEGRHSFEVDIQSVSPNVFSLLVGGRSYLAHMAHDRDKKIISLEGQQFIIQEPQEEAQGFQTGDDRVQEGQRLITAPMPGKVIQIMVTENEEVRKNQTLAIVEAMKMENEIKSSIEGIVKKIFVSAGDLVNSEKPLIELESKK
ncbi:MAG: biotin/lipoyl-containing protein [Candidatus Aminicenantales bacterium]